MCRTACSLGQRPRHAAVLLAVTLVCLLCAIAHAAAADGDTAEPVYLLNAVYSVDSAAARHANAIWAGIDAALFASNYSAAGGRPIVIVQPDFSAADMNDMVGVVQNALNTHSSMLGVIGPYSDMRLAAVLADAPLQQQNVTFLAPFTGSSAVRKWNNASYFTRADPRAELLVMVRYAANTLRARRTAFMYLTGVDYGDSEYEAVVSTSSYFAMDPPVLYARPYVYSNEQVEPVAFNALANTRPQVIYVWGMPGYQVTNFLIAVLTDPRTSAASIIVSFALEPFLYQIVKQLQAAGLLAQFKGQLMSSATAYPFAYKKARYMQEFHQEMEDYLDKSANGQAVVTASGAASSSEYLSANPDVAQLMVVGWLSGKLIQQTLEQSKWIVDRNTYREGLFQQNRYIIGGDFVLGDYGGPCDALAASTGAVCECNQGGHSAYMIVLQNGTWELVDGETFTYAQNLCYSTEVTLPKPINNLVLYVPEYPRLQALSTGVLTVVPLAATFVAASTTTINLASLALSTNDAAETLSEQLTNYSVDIISGTMLPGLNIGDALACDILFPQPRLTVAERNYIYTMPVLEQEVYLLYMHLDTLSSLSSTSTKTNVVLRNYTDAEVVAVTDLLLKSAATFNVPNPSITNARFSTHLSQLLVPDSVNLFVGLQISDAADIAAFLSANARAVVVICFDDLSVFYEDLVAAFAPLPASVQARLVSYSNLPLWTDTSVAAHAASPLLLLMHTILPDPRNHTPALLRNLATAVFLQTTLVTVTNVDASSLADTIYRNNVMSAYAVSFGPYLWGCTNATLGQSCSYKNYGAQSIVMLSMERILNATVPVTTPPTTPSLVYSPREETGLTTAQRSGIIAGSVVGGLLLIAALVVLPLLCCRGGRNNDAAPKDGDEPVTLIFTDIESSTALWATLPQLMADAIAAHHRVIRQLIRKYGCYEVKTVGDSFMIACKDAYSAVRLACEIQSRLLEYDWGTDLIDSTYRRSEMTKADDIGDYQPPTARLSEEEYAALWRGLRVRIGIHTGLSDIRYDEVTKGYDYYGDTSNMAARTEAIANGGQVVATETAWWALSDEERDATKCTEMGPQGLRGVPYAVGMYQLNPVPGRTHAALRTEIEAILPDDGASEAESSAADALLSSSDARSGPAATAFLVLTSTFAPYPPPQRVRELQPLLTKWSVAVPPRPSSISEEDYCTGLVNRLAVRIATVTLAKQRLQQDNAASSAWAGPPSAHEGGNPLLGGTGTSLGTGARCRAGQQSPSPSAEVSAMRESRIFRRSMLSSHPPLVPSRKLSRSVQPAEPADVVVPFQLPSSQAGSLEGSAVFGGPGLSLEAITVPMPMDLRMRRRRSRSEGSEMLSSEL